MKKFLSCTKTVIILLIATVLSLGFYTYMIARPISYGMPYHNKIVYDGMPFEGTMTFHPDGTVVSENTNFEDALEDYYYYKDGYVFTLFAVTESARDVEIEYINNNFEKAVAAPFYGAKVNAFRHVSDENDRNVTTYTCNGAVVFALVGGAVLLVLVSLTAISLVLSKKAKSREEEVFENLN